MRCRKFWPIFDRLNDILASITGLIMLFMLASVSFEVVMRYFFNRPSKWIVEANEYSLVYIAFLGAAWLLKKEGHVKIDVVVDLLNKRHRALLDMITYLFSALVMVVITWYAGRVIVDHIQRGYTLPTVLAPPSFIVLGVIPIGSLLFAIQFFRQAYGYLMQWKALEKKEHGA